MSETLITPAIAGLVGRPMWDPETALVRDTDILRFYEMLGDDPIYDASGTLIAPPLFLPPFHHGGVIGEDGRRIKPGELVLDVPVTNRLMAGCAVEFHESMREGDKITATTTVADIYEKKGSTGPMLFIVTETSYTDARGSLKRRERWTIIRR
jgi:hydroxyacyl-ACP dehydratase HTD2-like protein with hotdog domain